MSFKRLQLKIKPRVAIFGTFLIGAQLGLATPVLIDKFTTPEAVGTLTAVGNSHNQQGGLAGEVLGAARILDARFVSGPARTLDFKAEGNPLNDLSLNAQNGVTGSGLASYCGSISCGTASFDGLIGTTTPTSFGLGGVDLTSAGTNTQLRVIGNSDQIVTIYATFYKTASIFARVQFNIPGDILDHAYQLKFNNIGGDALFTFAGGATSTIFTSVNAITFLIQGSNSSDTFISYFGADNAPEPATFGMLAGGLGGLLWFARKRANHQ